MKYAFEGIGPQPPETVIQNPTEFSPEQLDDALNIVHERAVREVIATAGKYATQLVRKPAVIEGASPYFIRSQFSTEEDRRHADLIATELAFPFSEGLEHGEERPYDPQRTQEIEEGVQDHDN